MTREQILLDCSESFNLQVWMAHNFEPIQYTQEAEEKALKEIEEARQDYFNAKIELANKVGIDKDVALSLTNAQLVARVLNLQHKDFNTDQSYHYISPLTLEVGDDQFLPYFLGGLEENFTTRLAGCDVSFSRGGVHGSLSNFSSHSTPTTTLFYSDITSFYPSIIKYYKYLDNKLFNEIYEEHLKNKTPATKLLLNTVSGLLELYDPKSARDMRFTGQLLIYLVLKEIIKKCPSFKLLNLNTDGFMYSLETSEIDTFNEVLGASELNKVSYIKTKQINRLWIKDVNNLVCEFADDEIKVAGTLNYGLNTKGKFSINNNATIIKKAVINTLLTDGDCADYIYRNEDYIHNFQFIANGGEKASKCVWGEEEIPVISRVYATKDASKGSVYWVAKDGIMPFKLPNLPNNCFVEIPSDIDKGYYIAQAKTILKQYGYKMPNLKEKEVKPMAEEQNIYQKLLKARILFLNSGISKGGVNRNLEFHYFTLDDIIPIATDVFNKVGLIGITSFDEQFATLTLVNTDKPSEVIVFTSPMREPDAIVSRQGKAVSNKIQLLGSAETYQRRYLYLMALDIVEADSIDEQLGNEIRSTPTSVSRNVVSPAKREEAKIVLVNGEAKADADQVAGLERVIKTLVDKNDPKLTKMINQLYAETNHLKDITKDRCEKAVLYFSEQVEKE